MSGPEELKIEVRCLQCGEKFFAKRPSRKFCDSCKAERERGCLTMSTTQVIILRSGWGPEHCRVTKCGRHEMGLPRCPRCRVDLNT